MGQKHLAVLTGDHINEGSFFFLQENVWPFCRTVKKRGRNNEVAVRRGSTVLHSAHISLYSNSNEGSSFPRVLGGDVPPGSPYPDLFLD